jgi:hypothetical protein
MIIRLKDGKRVEYGEETWQINLKLSGGGSFLRLDNSGKEVLSIGLEEGRVKCRVWFDAREKPLELEGSAAGEIALVNLGCRLALYSGGSLQDEDWPIGRAALNGALISTNAEAAVLKPDVRYKKAESGAVLRTFTGAQGFRPEGFNANAGDCMPFCDNGTYHLFYLFDRRQHKSKWGLGAHQWAHISSDDLVNWREHPMAVGIDDQSEGSICTGSVIASGGRYYAFYAVRSCDGSPARLTWAVSDDCVHFAKSGRELCLKAPYYAPSARDPKVFKDNAGVFHMLVTTSTDDRTHGSQETRGYRGALAHLVSDDLENWEQLSPFVALDIPDEPECSDWFYLNGFYYLVYSNFGRAQYFISETPLGPWRAPESNLVGDEAYFVPKAAIYRDRIIFAGFRRNGGGYGGTVEFIEAKQAPDGALSFTGVEEMK